MLQQTQVATVLPYFDRWQRELPDFSALASASEAKVMKLWEGLGYYSRARNLHKLAQLLIERKSETRTPREWMELPGIGPYTAAAITSISFSEPAACVDGNVIRILARLTNERTLFANGSGAAKFFTPLAGELIVGADPGTHNQAMMELGATICVRQKPMCLVCPVATLCAGFKTGEPEKLPRLQPKEIEQSSVIRAWCESGGKLLLKRGHATAKRLAGLHELPEFADLGLSNPDRKSLLAIKRRAITRFQIVESIHQVRTSTSLLKKIRADDSLEWVPLSDLHQVTLSGPHKRWIGEILTKRETA